MAMRETEPDHDLSTQRATWRSQVGNLPPLRGGKASWVPVTLELIEQVSAGLARDATQTPTFPANIMAPKKNSVGAPARQEPLTWGQYGKFLKSIGLVQQSGEGLALTATGDEVHRNLTVEPLARAILTRTRLLAETLEFVINETPTVEEVNDYLTSNYDLDWASLGNTRMRTDWLESLNLIEPAGSRRWRNTAAGEEILHNFVLVRPQAIKLTSTPIQEVRDAPAEIQEVLVELRDSVRSHESRKTYNIWVPSPPSSPNKVQNLRTIVNAAVTPVQKEELLQFVADEFNLRRSSVDSMLPFMRASGILEEVGLGVYEATEPAKSWIASDDDVNFIRIMHANMRFVGEMIRVTNNGATRREVYSESQKFGLNVDKSRWIASLLEDTGLIEQPKHGTLRATSAGIDLIKQLPLAERPATAEPTSGVVTQEVSSTQNQETLGQRLVTLSRSPNAGGKGSGMAFESAINDALERVGFETKLIGGSGNTDVLVQWKSPQGDKNSAVIEVKSRSSGSVNHTDVSDVALETHKKKHGANFVALIGPSFAGGTIEGMAQARDWALLDADSFGKILETSMSLGLAPHEISHMLQGFNGHRDVLAIVDDRQRQIDILTYVISQLAIEAKETGEAITPRDISRDGRRTELSPSTEEIVDALNQLQAMASGAVRLEQEQEDPRFSSYLLGEPQSASRKLHAIATALDHGYQQPIAGG